MIRLYHRTVHASVAEGSIVPFREIARAMDIPQDFLAKILKTLVNGSLVQSVRGAHGGYRLARPACEVSFLDVIEAVEGPVRLNVCLSETGKGSCAVSPSCTMYSIWKQGQERMLEVYRGVRLDTLAMKPEGQGLSLLQTPETTPAA
ncbi:MAG: RrF2 family transcriptional regulator [Acidiferrobacterales bacterium]